MVRASWRPVTAGSFASFYKGEHIVTIGLLFWLLMVIWFVFGLYANWSPPGSPGFNGFIANNILLFVLLFLLGWGIFGFVVKGPGGP